MSYKRLTEILNGRVIDNCKNCPNFKKPQVCTEEICNEIKKNRLAELEEKIENGTLVELPLKAGDMVYEVINDKYSSTLPFIQETIIEKVVITKKGLRLKLARNSFYETAVSKIGKTIFTTKEAAEAKLKELRGE